MDESFDELLEQSSLGAAGARRIRERTSPEAGRIVLRLAELHEALDAASDDLAMAHILDQLEAVDEQLESARSGQGPILFRLAINCARNGWFQKARQYLERSKNHYERDGDQQGAARAMTALSILLLQGGKVLDAGVVLQEMAKMLESANGAGTQLKALSRALQEGERRRPNHPRNSSQPDSQGGGLGANKGPS
ncbi:hypothetical protein [Streptomyces sp. NPDC051286]|uniref:hypothetical protein n=1 Tax=Streptomyces sp. NPDC051286 TaxID=3365647 RepID=UPI0037945716